jgi:hypothetical protein
MFRRFLLMALILPLALWGQQPQSKPELERLNGLIEELTALKAQAAAIETRIDTILRALAEQRGALQQNPPVYNALNHLSDEPDPKPQAAPVRRCAAITSSGKRCTRGALEGSRYCRQHQLSHAK